MSRSFLRSSEIRPIDIGPEFFAGNGAVCGLLNLWAALGRDLPDGVYPLVDDHRTYPEMFGKLRLHPALRQICFEFHGLQFSASLNGCQ